MAWIGEKLTSHVETPKHMKSYLKLMKNHLVGKKPPK